MRIYVINIIDPKGWPNGRETLPLVSEDKRTVIEAAYKVYRNIPDEKPVSKDVFEKALEEDFRSGCREVFQRIRFEPFEVEV